MTHILFFLNQAIVEPAMTCKLLSHPPQATQYIIVYISPPPLFKHEMAAHLIVFSAYIATVLRIAVTEGLSL